jgi:hypothetical protein
MEALEELRMKAHESELMRIDEAKAARTDALHAGLTAASSVFGSLGNLVETLHDTEKATTDKSLAEQKKAARDAWGVSSALAIAQAAVQIPLSIANALGSAANPIVGAFMAIAAGVATGAAFAAVVAKTAAGPQFHSGGIAAGASGLAPDEFSAVLRAGEGVLTPGAVSGIGGEGAVHALNRGDSSSANRPMVVAVQIGSRLMDVQSREALDRPSSPLASALRANQPRRLGRFNPFAGA